MAATAAKGRRKNAPYLAQIDPRDLLAHPSNVRTQLGDLTELRASIAAQGVLQALTVIPEDDGHRIVAGHRRAAAAQALDAGEWPDSFPQTVPCLVRPDMEGMAAEQILAMLVENDQRADLTESERAAGYAQLELFGLDASEIARRTGRKVDHVTAALKLTKLGDAAAAAADKGNLTLEDVASLEEFDDDPKAMARILKDVGSSWGVKHKVQEERRKRSDKAKAEELKAELTAAGVKVVDKPKGWPYDCPEAKVDDLRTADDKRIDPDEVKTLDGFAAIVEGGYGVMKAAIICLDPEAHGYQRRMWTRYKSPKQLAAEEAEKQAREERAARLAEAREVRTRFVVETYGNAKQAKALLVEAMRATVEEPRYLLGGDDELVKALAGGDISEWATAGQDRLTRLLVAMWIAAEEHNVVTVTSERPWGSSKARAVAWLDRLVAAGYELSDVETAVRAELVAEPQEPDDDEYEYEDEGYDDGDLCADESEADLCGDEDAEVKEDSDL